MTASSLFMLRNRSRYLKSTSRVPFYARTRSAMSGASGYATNSYVTLMTVPADTVAVIDSIMVSGLHDNTAANGTVTFSIDGTNDLAFVFPGEVGAAGAVGTNHVMRVPVNGGMVIGPGKTLRVKTNNAVVEWLASAGVRGYFLSVAEAARLGLYAGQTTSAQPCNFAYSSGSLTASTRTVMVPAIAGYSIEINGVWFTGSTLTATAGDTLLLEFSDASATHRKVMKVFNGQTTSANYFAHRLNTGSGKVLIRGPVGYNLSATASTNAASGKLQAVVWGRYVPNQETYDGTGIVNTTSTSGGRLFWYYTETNTGSNLEQALPTTAGSVAVVKGFMSSANGAAGSSSGIGISTSNLPIGSLHVHVPSAGNTLVEDDLHSPVLASDKVGFLNQTAATGVAMTMWGELLPDTAVSSGYFGTALAGPIYYGA